VTHIDNDPITGSLRQLAEKADFTPVRPVIEVRGTCAACH
jgi:Fur family zinc uptake transcriptional regulator